MNVKIILVGTDLYARLQELPKPERVGSLYGMPIAVASWLRSDEYRIIPHIPEIEDRQ